VGGLTYTISPEKKMGARITDIVVGGKPLQPTKRYKVTGWASMGEVDGPPVWEVVANYLRGVKRVKLDIRPRVKVV